MSTSTQRSIQQTLTIPRPFRQDRPLHFFQRTLLVTTLPARWVVLAFFFCAGTAFAQSATDCVPEPQLEPQNEFVAEFVTGASHLTVSSEQQSTSNGQTQSSSTTSSSTASSPDATSLSSTSEPKQSKRILFIFPNYRSVSADTQLPPLSVGSKFWLATEDSFDYSSFIFTAALAGIDQGKNSDREFGQGAKGYGRYYWHTLTDVAVGNYMTEAIVPAVTREDPRYYTLGHGGFFRRTRYAVTRLLVTRTDSGKETFNFSEIVGNGAGAGISDLYYPSQERTWTKTGQKWITQIALDGTFNILKEFWPDINHHVFHGKY